VFCYLRKKMGFPRSFRGPLWLSPTAPLLPDMRAAPSPVAGDLGRADVRPHRRASPSPTWWPSPTRRPRRPPSLIPPQRRPRPTLLLSSDPRPSSTMAAPGPPPQRRPPAAGMPRRRHRHRLLRLPTPPLRSSVGVHVPDGGRGRARFCHADVSP
jgi:hypothetical protein